MAVKRALVVPLVLGSAILITAAAAQAIGAPEDTPNPASQFGRAETLYRQLRAIDPDCHDLAAWGALALAFSEIPEQYPTDPLAGDALWRVGHIHSCQSRAGLEEALPRAIHAYRTLVARYPSNAFAPEAYLRLAELSPGPQANTYYYRLLERYPATPAARKAQRLLTSARTQPGGHAKATERTPAANAASRAAEAEEKRENRPDGGLEAAPTPASGTPSGGAKESEPAGAARSTPDESAHPVWGSPAASARLVGVRHYGDRSHTRVVFDLDAPLRHEIGEAQSPPRLFVDLIGATLSREILRTIPVNQGEVRRVRLGINRPGVVRVVVDLADNVKYTFFTLANPPRLVIDVPSPEMSDRLAHARRPPEPEGGAEGRQLNLGIHRIVIDPGHGGTAPGAIGRTGLTEKDLTLDIANRLAHDLRASGYEVLLTRDTDQTIPLEARPVIATQAEADLFVSVHINAANNRKLSGFETYYLDLATDPTAAEVAARENASAAGGMGHLDEVLNEIVKNANKRESRDLANSIQDSLVLQMSKQYKGVKDLGVKHAPFVVLVGAEMPAVLVECSFVSNPTEERRLQDAGYRQQLADAIHIGIENYAARRRMLTATH